MGWIWVKTRPIGKPNQDDKNNDPTHYGIQVMT